MSESCIIRRKEIFGLPSIEIVGSFNGTECEVLPMVKKLVEEGFAKVVIDFRKTSYFTSNGLACLIIAHKHIRAAQGMLYVLGPTKDMLKVLQLTMLNLIFPIAENEEELQKLLGKNLA